MPRRNPGTLVDVGALSIIDTRRRTNRPPGLRRPWDYMLTIPEIAEFGRAFRPLYEEIQRDARSPDAFADPYPADCVPSKGEVHIWRKPMGTEFHASIRATSTYTSEVRWDEICTRFQQVITDHLGPDALAYLSDYEPGYFNHNDDSDPRNRCYRLYARFDAKIYFAEYAPIRDAVGVLDDAEYGGCGCEDD